MMSHIFNKDTALVKSHRQTLKYISEGDYPIGDNIDLRKEFHDILFGSHAIKPKGHYVKLVHNYMDKPTSDFDPINKEPRGPKPFETYEQIVLSYRARPWFTPYNEEIVPPGLINLDTYIYYFEYNVVIDDQDFIFEYGLEVGQPFDEKAEPIERFNIKLIDDRRADLGRIEYYRVIAKRDPSNRL